MAAGVVSGAAALLLEGRPRLSPRETKLALQITSSFMVAEGLVSGGAGSLSVNTAARAARPTGRIASRSRAQFWSGQTRGRHDSLGVWATTIIWGQDLGDTIIWGQSGDTIVWGQSDDTICSQGVSVRGVTLLQVSLGDRYTLANTADIYDWQFAFDQTDPVLSDRGWGWAVLREGVERLGGERFSYPTWVLVDPSGAVVTVDAGFDGWDEVADAIHAAGG